MKSPFTQLDRSSGTSEEGATQGARSSDVPPISAQSPRLVIRGESSPLPHDAQYIVSTDWVDFTFPLEDSDYEINSFFRSLIQIVGKCFAPLEGRGKGHHGWRHSYTLGESTGIFAIGGQHGRALLSLSGTACGLIHPDSWESIIHLIGGEYEGRITRWDGACDDRQGDHSIEWALEQYELDGFKSGGNKPRITTHGDWIKNEGYGRTLEIGRRKNGKLLRIYEKGKQLGDRASPWVRWEVEYHRKDREIPWDVLLRPGDFIAGAYPCMSWIHGTSSRIATFRQAGRIAYDYLTHHARNAYGQHISVMLAVEGSAEKVVEKLVRKGKPARLDLPVPPEYVDDLKARGKL